MRLSLGHWPPILSHVTCLFLGAAFHRFTAPPPAEPPKLERGALYGVLPWISDLPTRLPSSAALVRRTSPCLLASGRLRVYRGLPFMALDAKEVTRWRDVAKAASKGDLSVWPKDKARELTPCVDRATVRYEAG